MSYEVIMKGKFIKDNLYAVQQVVSATVFLTYSILKIFARGPQDTYYTIQVVVGVMCPVGLDVTVVIVMKW